jgi:Omp85 superfamily domain
MQRFATSVLAGVLGSAVLIGQAAAQEPPAVATEPTRAAQIAAQQAAKAKTLHPPVASRAEALVKKVEEQFISGNLHWHAFFENAYAGGGFTLGAGYARFVSPYNTVDLRGSITFSGYKRIEAEFLAPRVFNRRGLLSVLGGWREATDVGFYGLGTPNTSIDDRANFSFRQPYLAAALAVRPARRALLVGGGLEYSQWEQGPGQGSAPSVEEVYTPDTLPGLGAKPTYLQPHATVALDWRPAAGYARKGGYYGATIRSYADQGGPYSFRAVDYEAIQHIPILRDAWVLSLRGRVQTTYTKGDEVVPFFMLPALGSGSTLRGYSSWRFRDRNSLLLSAEWRVLANSFIDTAIFYDAGKVEARRGDLNLEGLKSNYGIGFRLHGPFVTPVRIELARGNEGIAIVFGASAAF